MAVKYALLAVQEADFEPESAVDHFLAVPATQYATKTHVQVQFLALPAKPSCWMLVVQEQEHGGLGELGVVHVGQHLELVLMDAWEQVEVVCVELVQDLDCSVLDQVERGAEPDLLPAGYASP